MLAAPIILMRSLSLPGAQACDAHTHIHSRKVLPREGTQSSHALIYSFPLPSPSLPSLLLSLFTPDLLLSVLLLLLLLPPVPPQMFYLNKFRVDMWRSTCPVLLYTNPLVNVIYCSFFCLVWPIALSVILSVCLIGTAVLLYWFNSN